MIIDVRGTHGSGKSFVVHELLRKNKAEDYFEDPEDKPIGHFLPEIDAGIVGRYDRTCGGCDGVSPVAEIVRRIRLMHDECTHVIFEGILVAHTFQRYHELAQELGDYHFCFLNTPLKKCISRVKARRRAKGNDKPLDPKNIIKDWNCIWGTVRIKMRDAGHNVHVIDWKDPVSQVEKLIYG